jgi:hypothetical protein
MNPLIVPSLILIACVIAFAVLAETKRREAARLRAQLDQALARIGKARQDGHTDGLFEGWKRGWGESYTAAVKAERRGESPLEAIHRVGALNAPALLNGAQAKVNS